MELRAQLAEDNDSHPAGLLPAARYFEVVNNLDVRELLSQVKVSTLVMHVRDDLVVPIDAGRQMAAGIGHSRSNRPVLPTG